MPGIPIYVDFHNHTTFSHDSTTSPKVLVDALKAHPYVKAAAVTDHDTLAGFEEIRKLAAPYPDIPSNSRSGNRYKAGGRLGFGGAGTAT